MRLIVAALALLAASCAPAGDTAPPALIEPTAGAVVDRPLVRVRMSPPGDLDLGDEDGSGTRLGAHAAWRTNGGAQHDVPLGTLERFEDEGIFVFAAALEPGENFLEAARCDAIDVCGWTGVSLRFTPRAGSPSPALDGAGLVVLPEGAATDVWPLDDERALLFVAGAPAELHMLDRSGRLDRSFGDRGVLVLPAPGLSARFAQDASGAILALLPGNAGSAALVRVGSDGALDPSFGDGGARTVGGTSAGDTVMHDLALEDDGAILLAGTLDGERAILQRLAPSGDEAALAIAEPVGSETIRAVRIDGAGRLVVASDSALARVLADGSLDAAFGEGGVVALERPSWPRAFVLAGDAVLVADHVRGDAVRATQLLEVGPSGTRTWMIDVAGLEVEPPAIAVDPDGRVLLAGSRPTDESAAWPMRPDLSQDGVEIVVARLEGGALDPSFGDAGLASASFRLAHAPIPREATTDEPLRLAVGPDGSPWVIARSIVVAGGTITAPRYETFTGLARFVP